MARAASTRYRARHGALRSGRPVIQRIWHGLVRQWSLATRDALTRIADECGSDKGTRLNGHRYTRVYRRLFAPLRSQPIRLLEIGLLRADADGRRAQSAAEGETQASARQAPSLEMWRRYFPRAQLFGFDIDDFSAVSIDRCTIVRGDMSSRRDLARLVEAVGAPLDIVIDDGSHASHHQQLALGVLFPLVRPGGYYVIEDLHWQHKKFERSDAPKTRDLVKRLARDGAFDSPFLTPDENAAIAAHARSVRLYDSHEPAPEALAVLQQKR